MGLLGFSWGSTLGFIGIAYIAYTAYTLAQLFYPPGCKSKATCFRSYLDGEGDTYQLKVFMSPKSGKEMIRERYKVTAMTLLWHVRRFDVDVVKETSVNVTIPRAAKKNGTVYVHAFLLPSSVTDADQLTANLAYIHGKMTTHLVQKAETFHLMSDTPTNKTAEKADDVIPPVRLDTPVTHWYTQLNLKLMTQKVELDQGAIPADLYHLLRMTKSRHYLPILYHDVLGNRIRDAWPVNSSHPIMPLTIKYEPISVGKLRLWVSLEQVVGSMSALGFGQQDIDDAMGIFADTNFYFLLLTITISVFHILFDFLAFKNDISFWSGRKSMVGLSSRTVAWRCISSMIVFLYLLDQETVSLLVLIPAGIGTVIEVWKVGKAFKVKVTWQGWRPANIALGTRTDGESRTEEFDSEAMRYLNYLLAPLCTAGAAYSLVYMPHKSWYSWCVSSLVNGVYAFGFLFMLPQLFLNYKLKSVAHLPWRTFMYKAFNTFIDDIFAFIITMPTAHRLACFRDDLVFLVYLYQRYLYPVDKTRANEFGQTFDGDDAKLAQDKKQK